MDARLNFWRRPGAHRLCERGEMLAGLLRASVTPCLSVALLALGFLPGSASAQIFQSRPGPVPAVVRAFSDSTGTLPGGSRHVRIVTDVGNVFIHPAEGGPIAYRLHVEADSLAADTAALLNSFHVETIASRNGPVLRGRLSPCRCAGRVWVTFDLRVPVNDNLDVSTGAGNVLAGDVAGSAIISTAGGNIALGNVAGSARLTSESGGYISVRNIGGSLTAVTGGGHITAGDILGDADLRTAGGHIRVASVRGRAHFDSGGGDVVVERAGATLEANTAGGQIEVGDSGGLVRALTGGGGIRVVRASGPVNLQAPDGSIYLTRIRGPVRASAADGGITAWFDDAARQFAPCDLQADNGNIMIYLPERAAVTIDARIRAVGGHHVSFDPAFPLRLSQRSAGARGWVRAEGDLNGGGQVLRLRAVGGDIHVAPVDVNVQLRLYRLQMLQLQRTMIEMQRRMDIELRQLQWVPLVPQTGHPADLQPEQLPWP